MKRLHYAWILFSALTACSNHPPHTETVARKEECRRNEIPMLVEGKYEGKNLYVQNPPLNCSDSSILFCVYKVTINDSIVLPQHQFKSSAFEIPLKTYGFSMGQAIQIRFYSHENCRPKILQPEIR
jgi:hypothetical protein